MIGNHIYKRIIALGLAAVTALSLSACSKGEEELPNSEFLTPAEAAKYVVELGDYSSMEVDLTTPEALQMLSGATSSLKPNKVTNRPVKKGDTVNIDYMGKFESTGEKFSGGTATGAKLTIGSGQFIDGFEDGLIGALPLDGLDLHLTFPEDYHSKEMAGKKVVFSVFVNYIEEYSAEDLENAERSVGVAILIDNVLAATKFKDTLPNAFIDAKVKLLISEIDETAKSMNMTTEAYLSTYYKTTVDEMKQQAVEYATEEAKAEIMYLAIAHKQGIALTEEEYEAETKRLAEEYGFKDDVAGFVKKYGGEADIRNSILLMQVSDYLSKNVVIKK